MSKKTTIDHSFFIILGTNSFQENIDDYEVGTILSFVSGVNYTELLNFLFSINIPTLKMGYNNNF